jgi:hypothetical protein
MFQEGSKMAPLEDKRIKELADAIYPILIIDEPDPETQRENRKRVTEAARAALQAFKDYTCR